LDLRPFIFCDFDFRTVLYILCFCNVFFNGGFEMMLCNSDDE